MKKLSILIIGTLGLAALCLRGQQSFYLTLDNKHAPITAMNRTVVTATTAETALLWTTNTAGGSLIIPLCNWRAGYTLTLGGFGNFGYTASNTARFRLRLVPDGAALTNGLVLFDSGALSDLWTVAGYSLEYRIQVGYNGQNTNNLFTRGGLSMPLGGLSDNTINATSTITNTTIYTLVPTVQHTSGTSNDTTTFDNWLIQQSGM